MPRGELNGEYFVVSAPHSYSCTAEGAVALFSQAGFRDTMPDVMEMVRARPPLVELCGRVHDACDMEATRWLRSS